MDRLLLTPSEEADHLGLSKSYIYELLASTALPSITIGRTCTIPRRALEDYVEARAAEQGRDAPHPLALHRGSATDA